MEIINFISHREAAWINVNCYFHSLLFFFLRYSIVIFPVSLSLDNCIMHFLNLDIDIYFLEVQNLALRMDSKESSQIIFDG